MPAQTLTIMQQFEKEGRRPVTSRRMPFTSVRKAIGGICRDAGRTAGIIAVQPVVGTYTGEVLEKPTILAAQGELQKYRGE